MFKLNEIVRVKSEHIEKSHHALCTAHQLISNTYRVITIYEPQDYCVQRLGCGSQSTIREHWLQRNHGAQARNIWLELEDKLRECYQDKAQ